MSKARKNSQLSSSTKGLRIVAERCAGRWNVNPFRIQATMTRHFRPSRTQPSDTCFRSVERWVYRSSFRGAGRQSNGGDWPRGHLLLQCSQHKHPQVQGNKAAAAAAVRDSFRESPSLPSASSLRRDPREAELKSRCAGSFDRDDRRTSKGTR